jgi:hypothetical protein
MAIKIAEVEAEARQRQNAQRDADRLQGEVRPFVCGSHAPRRCLTQTRSRQVHELTQTLADVRATAATDAARFAQEEVRTAARDGCGRRWRPS